MSSINYTVSDFTTEEYATVTYTNSQGFTYTREVKIPRDSEGNLKEELWKEILQGQLAGVESKAEIGVAVFKDPNEEVDSVTE